MAQLPPRHERAALGVVVITRTALASAQLFTAIGHAQDADIMGRGSAAWNVAIGVGTSSPSHGRYPMTL